MFDQFAVNPLSGMVTCLVWHHLYSIVGHVATALAINRFKLCLARLGSHDNEVNMPDEPHIHAAQPAISNHV